MARNKKRKVIVQRVQVPAPPRYVTPLQYRGYRATMIAKVVTTAIRWGGVVALGYFGYLSIRTLAGQTTFADIAIRVLGKLYFSQAVATVLGGGGIIYAWRERQLRHKVNETTGKRVSELEQEIDRRRTSSRLTRRGQTDPKDSV